GHGDTVFDPVSRASEIIEHHRHRLDETAAALGPEPRTAHEVSLVLFGDTLDASGRRFALAETLAHLERLVRAGRAVRHNAAYTDS
ncbi:MAG: MBL fold metallo-hydrolase, partial [Gaiellaceae bacterium]